MSVVGLEFVYQCDAVAFVDDYGKSAQCQFDSVCQVGDTGLHLCTHHLELAKVGRVPVVGGGAVKPKVVDPSSR